MRVYICSAAVTGGHPDKTEDDFLQQMCDEAMAIAKEKGEEAIDVQRTMRDIQRRVLKANESVPEDKQQTLHAADTIHLSDLGQLAMAYAILKGLGAPELVSSATIDAATRTVTDATGCRISDIETSPGSLRFTRLDEGLPFNNGLFSSLSYRFVPMDELSGYRLAALNLPAGKYQLTVSGREIGTYRSAQLARGINIASATANVWQPGGPWDAQATSLKSLTDARHDIDVSARLAAAYLPESAFIPPLNEQSAHANERIVQMQRLVARPRPYQFVLTREADETTITSPLEHQVFQRQTRTAGWITVSGRTMLDVDRVEVRFRGEPLDGDVPGGWHTVEFDPASGTFEEPLTFPAGGWFSMDVRLTRNGQTLYERTIKKFGVGEVFVGAGQSNSTNSGQFRTKQTSGMVSSFSGEHWQIADDPQPGVADKSQGGSYYPAFGDALSAHYRVPIGIAATGFGGTSVNAWQPRKEDGLFAWMMTRIMQLGPHGFRAVLWHQGESDVGMSAEEYYDKLKRVIVTSREQAGWDVPWFVAQVSYHNPEKPLFETTRTAQARLWADGVALEGPDTDTLTGDHRDHDGQGIHFSPKGLKAHGLLWAQKLRPFIDTALGQ